MVHVLSEPSIGLRERNKRRTRAQLIESAIGLCLAQGYDQTTVEQIALSAGVSSRTFSRYFATKEAVFLTLIEDYADHVALELARVPNGIGPLEALRWAHTSALAGAANRGVGSMSSDLVSLMLRVFNASETLRQAAFEYRHETTHALLAQRMGLPVDDRRVTMVAAVFSAVIVTACGDLVSDTDRVRLGPSVMIDRLDEAFGQLAVLASDVRPPVQEWAFHTVNG